jgi:polyisoprenoid-binding protein YceI
MPERDRRAGGHTLERCVMLTLLCPVALLTLAAGSGGPADAGRERWTADTARSRITIHVFKKGLLSGLAHDHHFVPGNWRATATFEGASPSAAHVEVIVAANSLRDQQPALSEKDREKIDRQAAGPEVLDARRYPEIRFASKSVVVAPGTSVAPGGGLQGTLTGTLSLHGQERPVSVPITATKDGKAWRARGSLNFNQSAFGIHPYSGFGGTIAVRDEVKLEYEIVLAPAS